MAEPNWLTDTEGEAWRRFTSMRLHLDAKLDRELTGDISIQDYGVLVNLSEQPNKCMRISELADKPGWETSRAVASPHPDDQARPGRATTVPQRRSGTRSESDWPVTDRHFCGGQPLTVIGSPIASSAITSGSSETVFHSLSENILVCSVNNGDS